MPPALDTQLTQWQVVREVCQPELTRPPGIMLSPTILTVSQAVKALQVIPRITINTLRVLPDMTRNLEESLLAQATESHPRS